MSLNLCKKNIILGYYGPFAKELFPKKKDKTKNQIFPIT